MLARILRLDVEEEHCKTISITPPSQSNSSIMLLLSKQNRALDRIEGDGNCLFRAISKELFGDDTHHKNLREIIIEYILTNSESFKQFLSNNSETIFEHCQTVSKLGTFGTQVEIYALAYFIHIPIYVYSMVGLASMWRWLQYNPKQILKYNPIYSNLPLPSPHNYHIELCHTNGNHFDRIIPLRQLFELPSNPSYEDYIKDLPTLSGIDDKENIIEL